jgi:large repetitive protein
MSGGGRRLSVAVTAALLALLAGAAVALAEPPLVTIESPSSGSVSNNRTPSFSGVTDDALDGMTVRIYAGTTVDESSLRQSLSTLVPSFGGNWSLGPVEEALADGMYTAQATQTDAAQETGSSEPVTFTVDATPPSVSMSPVPSPTNDPAPTLEGGAGAAEGDAGTVTVTIHDGKGVVASANVPVESESWSFTPPELPDGTYTAQATQTDLAGNIGESAERTFILDTTAPSVSLNPITSPSGDATPTLSGAGGSAPGDYSSVTVTISSGETQVSSESAAVSSGHWTLTSPHLDDGTYTAKATQRDQAGNIGSSATQTFTVETASPTVTLEQPTSPSKDTTPSFAGTASDTEPITVRIYKGSKAEGTLLSSAQAAGSGGNWSSGDASPALSSGEYTAIATQPSSLGNPVGKSNPVSFEVDTASPTVTLNPVRSPSNDTTPSFTGFGSDKTEVTVQIFEGASAEGAAVSSATAQGTGGEWSSGQASPPLSSGQYTAVATQPSSLGNPAGKSDAITFLVDTSRPTVTLNQPKSPSNNTAPSFTGTASDIEPVTIHIYAGPTAEGSEVSKAAATGTGSGWSSGAATPALTSGQYTAIAEQPSSLGNAAGRSSSVTFIVDTSSPTVTITQPATPSNNTAPSFKGTATSTTPVVVHVYEGSKAEGTEVSKATAAGTGSGWSTGSATPALAPGEHTYTAVATQESPLGNPAGRSAAVTFVVETNAPTVTLSTLPLRSNDTTPSFKGTASDSEPVTIRVYKGSKAEGTAVSTLTAEVTAGSWEANTVTPLANGEYTARATQKSRLGNPEGASNAVTFAINISSPAVTLAQPVSPSNNTTPSFSGSASDTEQVTVRLYKGPKAEGSILATLKAAVVAGNWHSVATSALSNGQYTAIASQPSSFGNPEGISNAVTFIVNTSPPTVTLKQPPSPSKEATPSFTGTASDTEPITVHIYKGSKAEGTQISSAKAAGNGAGWSSANSSPALSSGQYTAVASQASSLGNPEGKSNPVTFEVDTTSPIVTITSPVNGSISNKLTPEFSGTSSGTHASNEITIKIYEGPPSQGRNVSSTKATISAGKWTSSPASPALATGTHTYTAVASEASLLGNPAGTREVSFTVNTEPPAVTLDSPPSPSNSRTPTFEGTATDTTPVTVRIFEGRKAEGKEVASASATPASGGAWVSGPASTLPSGRHTYTAIAIQSSSLGNPAGRSTPVTFIVDPEAPTVTLNAPPALTNDPTPSFTGSASNTTQIVVHIYKGATPVATASATGTGGNWSSGNAAPRLADGRYTVQAEQSSLVGEHVGRSQEFTFSVDTLPPQVTLSEPTNGSSTDGESELAKGVAGSAEGDIPRVTAQLFSGPTIGEGQSPLQSIEVGAAGQAWSATFAGLGAGTYTVRAQQRDEAGNVGLSTTSTFTVNHAAALGSASPSATGPAASFSWFPKTPRTGESVTLLSLSTDAASPIIAFAWDLGGTGAFSTGGPGTSTTFSTPGNHTVQLRVTDANGLSSVAAQAIPVSAPAFQLMQPFPIVRITSTSTRSGIRLRQLGVLAGRGARITVQCRGRACPAKSQSHMVAASSTRPPFVEFRRFERSLAAGVILEIRITKAGAIGKYTRLAVRRGRAPVRFDACLVGVTVKPVDCP